MIESLYKPFQKWSAEGTLWLISDTHFNDNELAAGINRPSTDEMVKIINSKVGKKDTLIHLGDVGDIAAAAKLRGHKILIMGNHDTGKSNYQNVFEEIYEGPLFISDKILLSHEPIILPFAFNFHGHDHMGHFIDNQHFNVNFDVLKEPLNFHQWIKKSGSLSKINSIHRDTINKATERKIKKKKSF